MKKTHTLLKVMAIIYIVFGAIGLLSGIYSFINMDSQNAMLASMGMESLQLTTGAVILTLVNAIIEIAAGILVFAKKDKKIWYICGIVLVLLVVVSIISTLSTTGFSALSILSFIMPALYLWGVYLSE